LQIMVRSKTCQESFRERQKTKKDSLTDMIRNGTFLLEQKQFRRLFALAESLSATYNGG